MSFIGVTGVAPVCLLQKKSSVNFKKNFIGIPFVVDIAHSSGKSYLV